MFTIGSPDKRLGKEQEGPPGKARESGWCTVAYPPEWRLFPKLPQQDGGHPLLPQPRGAHMCTGNGVPLRVPRGCALCPAWSVPMFFVECHPSNGSKAKENTCSCILSYIDSPHSRFYESPGGTHPRNMPAPLSLGETPPSMLAGDLDAAPRRTAKPHKEGF